ncbi:glyoxalase superfamily protein [Chitinophaga rhizophila]|uniref:glyoxalase superfamily protein n=1 Tax=Chitinophaga rhizophila TaxID=2866212 RepID=UPI001EEC8954|nr:glyoxalase superfamily protein [Chitinophaga rhizophila]
MAIVKPVLRAFGYAQVIEFYVEWLGFQVNWEHKPEDASFYMQLSLGDIVLHLSAHHGDASPGGKLYVDQFEGLEAYHHILIDKQYK